MNEKSRITSITLAEWDKYPHSDEEKREVFLNVDVAMKYVHDRGYCVNSFNPREIQILNNSSNQIMFNTVLEMPDDNRYQRTLKDEDIFNSSIMQVGLYSKCINHMNVDFVKEHFDDFTQFLPEGDVPYYRGIIERGNSVYFSEYEAEKRKRDLINLEKEINGEDSKEASDVKTIDITNNKINDNIYKQINMRNSAFINIVIFPIIVVFVAFLYAVMYFVLNGVIS